MPSAPMRSQLRVRYDRDSDVLYLSRAPGRAARSREEQPGAIWRYDTDTGELVGLTVVDFSTYWRKRRGELMDRITERFGLAGEEVRSLVESV